MPRHLICLAEQMGASVKLATVADWRRNRDIVTGNQMELCLVIAVEGLFQAGHRSMTPTSH